MTQHVLSVLLTLGLASQTSAGRWTQRAEILDSRQIPSWCWDYSASDGKRATILISVPVLGDTALWGASFDKNTRAEAVTRIVYLGQDATGISLEILTVAVAGSSMSARISGDPLDACVSSGLLSAALNTGGVSRSVRTPLDGTMRMAIGKEEVYFKIAGGTGFSIQPVDHP